MTIREMHYDFKKKFNKIDSQKNKNLLVPEIDWSLNEAEELFIKIVANPKLRNNLGFEVSQATTEDIKSIVVSKIVPVTTNIMTLPTDYKYWSRGRAKLTKGGCIAPSVVISVEQHDNTFEESQFYSSSFEWRELNAVFNSQGLQFFTDGTFTVNEVNLTYIRQTKYMHNAQDFGAGTYNRPSGVALTGSENCELPAHTHRGIVDIAVMLASGEIQASDFQIKAGKLSFNQIV